MGTIWKVNGREYTFDLAEADALERYETAQKSYETAREGLEQEYRELAPEERSYAAYIRAYCRLERDFFDTLLDGQSKEIFEGITDNYVKYTQILGSFGAFVNEQLEENNAKMNKYAPAKTARKKK